MFTTALMTEQRPLPPRMFVPNADLSSFDIDEPAWRQIQATKTAKLTEDEILVTRWIDQQISPRRAMADAYSELFVVSIAIKATQIRLCNGSFTVFDGAMPSGMVHITAPSACLAADFRSPCEFVHIYVSSEYLRKHCFGVTSSCRSLLDGWNNFLVRDNLVEQLCRTIVDEANASDVRYMQVVGHAILLRLLRLRQPRSRVAALPRPKLKRVLDYVAENLDENLTLADLAAVSGLSRMHFAAQFRRATGCKPHDYLLSQRVERAKALLLQPDMSLAEIALSVGFQAQSHFTTVFKRLTGETPGFWRQNNSYPSEYENTNRLRETKLQEW